MSTYDVIIIGAGMTGSIIARELSVYRIKVAVMERSLYVCGGQSKANGAIIHGGHDPEPETLKAQLNVEGNRMFPRLCEELGVSFRQSGIYVIAFERSEFRVLLRLLEQGERNGVRGLRILKAPELRVSEPKISSKAVGALCISSGGIVDVHRLVIACAEHASMNGCQFRFGEQVLGLLRQGKRIEGVITTSGEHRSRLVVNCAGVYADDVMRMAGIENLCIIPRKGEYYILDRAEGDIVSRPCFQVPTPGGKGILIFPTTNGNSIIGGDSVVIRDKADTSTTAEGYRKVCRNVRRLVPDIDTERIIASFAGIRAVSSTGDFLIEKAEEVEGLINVAGIASPGLSAAPAIARSVIDLIGSEITLKKANGKTRSYRINPLFRDASDTEKESLLRENQGYGRVVCRCENITEGDILEAIYAPIPARTVDAIKLRTKAGIGRCQGAFDMSRIIEILTRETGIRPMDVLKNGWESRIVYGYLKGQGTDETR
jgi:glycerol-3-phosphate dehydrogenase